MNADKEATPASGKRTIEEAIQVAKAAYKNLEPLHEYIPNEDYVKLGILLWDHTYKGRKSDVEAFDLLMEFVKFQVLTAKQQNVPVERIIAWKMLLDLPEEQCKSMWACRWVDQGCPRIVIDMKYAALLMATDVGQDMLEKVIPPWHSFLIEIPENLLEIEDESLGTIDSIRRIMVQHVVNDREEKVWNILSFTNHNLQLWRHGLHTEDLVSFNSKDEFFWEHGIKVKTRDERALVLIGKLIVSACVAMSDPDNLRKQKRSKGRGGSRSRLNKGMPELQTFVLGKPVKINCRQAILDYMNGNRKSSGPTIQFLVRGHWKQQPYGTKHSLRKLIHVEPYWKGDEEARILSRTVLLQEPEP
jgi:hypothetical protein